MDRAETEVEVRRLLTVGEPSAAVTLALQGFGPELMGFLVALAGSAEDAGDVFADLCVRIWKGLPGFRWDSSLRTWTYVMARGALHEHRHRRAAWSERVVASSDLPDDLEVLVTRIRTTTMARIREERDSPPARLRARLSADDQVLLTLRADGALEWRDIARVLADDSHPDGDEVSRAAAVLRKRFERLKVSLRKMEAEDDREP
jgi:RNA polymerase sigma-70 factor (ECF subfamily)